MKAHAPERIYFGTQAVNPFYGLTRKCANDDIEYVRLDAFIEKATDWLGNHIYEYLKMNRTWNEPDYDPN